MRVSCDRDAMRPHILVVDDEPQIRDLLRSILEREGYRVTVRSEAAAALEDVRKGSVTILITDLKMPRMSGLELLQAAKSLSPDLGSILITGYASTETAVKALRFGADDFITKPFALDDLRRVVDRVLRERRMLVQERDALDIAREEAAALRQRSRRAESALETAKRDLSVSRRDLERRVRDLEFVGQLTALLARETDLQCLLETTARILTARFKTRVTHIEVALAEGVFSAQHVGAGGSSRMLNALGIDLVSRARREGRVVARDEVLGFERPLEALAAPLDLSTGPAGGITLLRAAPGGEDTQDGSLFSLVPRALAVAVEAELQRRAALKAALDVATGILEALEGRGTLFRGHAARVSALAGAMAKEMHLSPRLQEVVRTAARLHDVGEVGVPEDVLRRDGPLSERDRQVLHLHPIVGARILAPLGEAAAFVRHHKERPDGGGYPDGLTGDEIPIGAGIIGVAEAYDAMTHHRSYRPRRSRKEALDEIERLRGSQFVPAAVDALLEMPTAKVWPE
jgi:response regulator RpfG family c-di-GMP phosphodiesterase